MQVQHPSDSMTLCLAGEQLVSLVTRSPMQVLCESGVVWVTVEGDAQDRILRAAQIETLPGGRLIVVQALGGARVAVAAA